jgi:hypothetical protein
MDPYSPVLASQDTCSELLGEAGSPRLRAVASCALGDKIQMRAGEIYTLWNISKKYLSGGKPRPSSYR